MSHKLSNLAFMKRYHVAPILLVLSILTAQTAFAQSYSVTGGGTITANGSTGTLVSTGASGCVSLSRDISFGSRGADVTALQNFLLAQNYPGSGSWMVTGYFGSATRQAVFNFQSQKGIAGTGIADAQTRGAIQNSSCGGNYASQTNTYTYNNNLYISSLSVSSGPIGTSVTIYGNGFDALYNNIYFGNSPISGNIASNGTSLTFSIPPSYGSSCASITCYWLTRYTNPGTYQIYVTNARGTSNSLAFSVTPGGFSGCSTLAGSANCYGYGYGNYGSYGFPSISNMYPTVGAVGSAVTILGSGFSQRGNSVHFGSGVITGLTSSDSSSLSFIVPPQLTGYGSQSLSLGTYNVSVSNETGATSNVIPFTVTSLAEYALLPSIMITNSPVLVSAGTQGTWTVTVSNMSSSNVTVTARWGDEGVWGAAVSSPQILTTSGTQTLSFTHAYLASGTYSIVFTATNSGGSQNSASVAVTVAPYGSNQLTLSTLSPAQGRVGTLVTLTGTGFTLSGNAVRFGVGGTTNLTSSNNGTNLYYTIPFSVGVCDLVGTGCTAPTAQVTPGTYPMYVTNAAGQTTTQNFTVIP